MSDYLKKAHEKAEQDLKTAENELNKALAAQAKAKAKIAEIEAFKKELPVITSAVAEPRKKQDTSQK